MRSFDLDNRKYATILDPSDIFRAGLGVVLLALDYQVIEFDGSPRDFPQESVPSPMLIIFGPNVTEGDAFAMARMICNQRGKRATTVMFSADAQDDLLLADASVSGIHLVLPSHSRGEKVAQAIRDLESKYINRDHLDCSPVPPQLTDRETGVLSALSRGISDKDIAILLGLRLPTVRNHIQRVLEKLEVHHRRDAIRRGQRLGLIPGSSEHLS